MWGWCFFLVNNCGDGVVGFWLTNWYLIVFKFSMGQWWLRESPTSYTCLIRHFENLPNLTTILSLSLSISKGTSRFSWLCNSSKDHCCYSNSLILALFSLLFSVYFPLFLGLYFLDSLKHICPSLSCTCSYSILKW